MGQRATIPATRVVTVAVTNKLARIVWAIMERGSTFRERPFGIARRKLAWQDVRLQAPLCRTNSEVGKGNDDAMAFGRRYFAPIKSAEQQSILMLHRTRDPLVRQPRCW